MPGSSDKIAKMLSEQTLSTVAGYWAEEMGCPAKDLFREPIQMISHGERLADYNGIFALFRDGQAIVSFPEGRMEAFRDRLPGSSFSPAEMAAAFSDFTVIGPAYIGYAESISPALSFVRSLGPEDRLQADSLRTACSEAEWDHGGSEVGSRPASGAFADGRLVALAGYEVWDNVIAHISVVAHPAYRCRGYGRGVVAHLAAAALQAGLIPQYRTLDSNTGSIRIAEALGFERCATSVAVRLGVEH